MTILESLNTTYEKILREKLSIYVAYSFMVKKFPFRVLASFSYDKEERPLKTNSLPKPTITEYSSDRESNFEGNCFATLLPAAFQNISEVLEHDEYIQMIINAKTVAQLKKSPESITWRGYVTDIHPDFELSREGLKHELVTALQCLSDISNLEHKVINIYFILLTPHPRHYFT